MRIDGVNIKQSYIKQVIDMLCSDGEKIIREMIMTNEITNRSYNLHDAYIYGVYHKGILVAYGFADGAKATSTHKGWEREGIGADKGRNYAIQAVQEYKPKTMGFELITINSIYYAEILEDGTYTKNGGRSYKIVSQALGGLSALTSKYGGKYDKLTHEDW